MRKRIVKNSAVIVTAMGFAVFSVYSQTDWLEGKPPVAQRERCYGVVRAAKNDCANAKHSCATQASTSRDPDEWIMLPTGLCERIVGGKRG